MMWWYDGWGGGWAWVVMAFGMVAFWGLVAWVVLALVRGAGSGAGSLSPTAASDPERILAERFARGEIDTEEYERRLATLRGPGRKAA